MTVLRRSSSAPAARTGRGKPPPLAKRFPKGMKVQVYDDYHDVRYADRFGQVIKTVEEGDETYPKGRVAVMLVWQELHHKIFGGKAPNPIWFKPNDLERL